MKRVTVVVTIALAVGIAFGDAEANTYGSVEPIANPDVIDTRALRQLDLDARQAFAERLLQCGVVEDVIQALSKSHAIATINDLNTRFEVGAGGFAGETNPAYVYTIVDNGPNAASLDDIKVLTDGLGYVLSQGSAFLLDADDTANFDFPANYVVLNFDAPPPLERSAALFETVGHIDHELFDTDSSGYTQFGRAYLSLQSFVPDEQFIAGYVEAAQELGVEYTPVVGGMPSLFQGGAAFPGNDWSVDTKGEAYLARIPAQSHRALARLRAAHLRFTREALKKLKHDGGRHDDGEWHDRARGRELSKLKCQ